MAVADHQFNISQVGGANTQLGNVPVQLLEDIMLALRGQIKLTWLVKKNEALLNAKMGDTTTDERILDLPTLQDLTAGGVLAFHTFTVTENVITLNQYWGVGFKVSQWEEFYPAMKKWDGFLHNAIIPIAEKYETSLFALYASLTNTYAATGTSGELTVSDFTNIGRAMTDNLVPDSLPKTAVISTYDYAALLNSGALVDASQSGSTDPLRKGITGKLRDWDVTQSVFVPKVVTTTPAATTYHNLFMVPHAYVMTPGQLGVPKDGNLNAAYSSVSDPESGLSFRTRTWHDPSVIDPTTYMFIDTLFSTDIQRNVYGIDATSVES